MSLFYAFCLDTVERLALVILRYLSLHYLAFYILLFSPNSRLWINSLMFNSFDWPTELDNLGHGLVTIAALVVTEVLCLLYGSATASLQPSASD